MRARSLRGPLWALVVGVGTLGAGCASKPLPPAEAAELAAPPPDEQAIEALDGLVLGPEQRHALGALRSKLREQLGAADTARAALVDEVLAGLERGSLDRARVDPAVQAFLKAADEARPHVLRAVSELHAMLTPAQRSALVKKLEQKRQESEEQGKERGRAMLRALGLSLGQAMDIGQAFKERFPDLEDEVDELKLQAKEAVKAFESDAFDPASLALAKQPVVERWLTVTVGFFEIAAARLDEEQRRTLVAMARKNLAGSRSTK